MYSEQRKATKIEGDCIGAVTQDLIDIKHALVKEYGTQKALALAMGVDESTITRRFSDDSLCDFVARLLILAGKTIVATREIRSLYFFAEHGLDARKREVTNE